MPINGLSAPAPEMSDRGQASRDRSAECIVAENLAENLAFELRAADVIIHKMLNALTSAQKRKLAQQLGELGVSPNGMTRANERHDELSRYDAIRQRMEQS